MPFAAAHSLHPKAPTALAECVGQVLERHGPHPDLLVVVATEEHHGAWTELGHGARTLLQPGCQVGVCTEAVIAGPRVARRAPALGLWAAWGVEVAGVVALCGPPTGTGPSAAGIDPAEGFETLAALSTDISSLLVLAERAPGTEEALWELGRRHGRVRTAGAVLAPRRTSARGTSFQLDGRGIDASVLVVALGASPSGSAARGVAPSAGVPHGGEFRPPEHAMEVATSMEGWPPPRADEVARRDPVELARSPEPGDAPPDDLVLDIFQRRAAAALVFDTNPEAVLAGDLSELTEPALPLLGIGCLQALGPVLSPGFGRRPAVSVAIFRDIPRSEHPI